MAAKDECGDERFEREDDIDSREGRGKDQGCVLGDDDLDVNAERVNKDKNYYGESGIVGARYGY